MSLASAARMPVLVLFGLATAAAAAPAAAQPPAAAHSNREPLPPIRHVFVLLLENQSYHATFGSGSPAPYLARTLPARGALLTHY